MRTILTATMMWSALFTLTSAWGQGLPSAPDVKPDPKAERRDLVLKYWEQALAQVTSLEADCERTTEDKTFNNRELYKGTARFLKGNGPNTSRASLYLVKDGGGPNKVFEQFVLSGQYFYEVAPSAKEIRVRELPKPAPGVNSDHNLVALLFGMKADQAKTRFDVELVHEDQNYFYLRIKSKLDMDRAEFDIAQLALIRNTYMPRRLEFLQPNKNKVTWDLPRIQTPANHLRPADFEAPNIPGYKVTQMPSLPPAPTKVRSAGN